MDRIYICASMGATNPLVATGHLKCGWRDYKMELLLLFSLSSHVRLMATLWSSTDGALAGRAWFLGLISPSKLQYWPLGLFYMNMTMNTTSLNEQSFI